MESIKASTWSLKTITEITSTQLDVISKFIPLIRNAQSVRDDCRQSMLNAAKKLLHLVTELQDANDELESEVNLAIRIYETDVPVHKNRYFTFDDNGKIREATQAEYDAITPKDAEEEVAEVHETADISEPEN